jgi:hypothetical protein
MQLWCCAGTKPSSGIVDVASRFARVLTTTLVVIGEPPQPCDARVVADNDLRIHGRLGAVTDAAYVVRPDGYLGFRCEPPDAEALGHHLSRFGFDTT